MAQNSTRKVSWLAGSIVAVAALTLCAVARAQTSGGAAGAGGGSSSGGAPGAGSYGAPGYGSATGGYGGPSYSGGSGGYSAPGSGGGPSGGPGYGGAPGGYGGPGYGGAPGGYGGPGYGAAPGGYGGPGYGAAPGGYGGSGYGGGPGSYGGPGYGGGPGGYGATAYGNGVGGNGVPGAGPQGQGFTVPGAYTNSQSWSSWRIAACIRDPRNCSSAPANGYLGPGGYSANTPGPGSYAPGTSGMGAYSVPGAGGYWSGTPSAGGYGVGAPNGPGTGGYWLGNSGMGNLSPGISGPSGYSASTSGVGTLPTIGGPNPASGFSSSSGFPSPGSLGPGLGGGGLGNSGGTGQIGGNSGGGGFGGGGIGGQTRLSNLLGGIDQNTLNTVAAQLGVSPDELNNLRNQVVSGAISPDQMQQLVARFGAMSMSDNQIGAIAKTLGLNDAQLSQIKQTLSATRSGSQPPTPFNPPQGPYAVGQQGPGPQMQGPGGMTPTPPWMLSSIEAKFQQIDNPLEVPETPATDGLVQFGYNFFGNTQVSTFAPVQNVPVGDNYVVGPGDEIDILLWGRLNTVLNPVVDRQGAIQVTELGPIHVAGLTFAEAKKVIITKAAKITGVQVDVTMGQLRTIEITVSGDVVQPGSYTISALARVSNALVAAGGVNKVGSLRNIEVRHGNQLVDVIDLYDVLLHGNNSADRRLEEGDVIFVPVIGSVIAVAGDVKRPAIYELAKDRREGLQGALSLAGGVSAFGYSPRIQVERIENHRRSIALDVPYNRLESQAFTIHDGDVIKVYPVLPGRANTVVLAGNVRRPGEFQWHKGMRVSDLIKKGEGILPKTYFKYALVRRLEGAQKVVHFMQVNLSEALANPHVGGADIALQAKDELDVYNEDDIKDLPSVAVNGEVRLPGRFVFNPDMKVSDLVYMAAGLKDDAFQDRAVLVRSQVTPSGRTVRHHIDVNLRAILNGNFRQDQALKPNDELFVRNVVDWQRPPQFVEVTGEVRAPGIYDYYTGMTVNDLVALAGGTADDAYLKGAELARTEVINGAQTTHTTMDVDLRTGSKSGGDRNLLLKPNDELLVKAASNYHLPFTVLVTGRVVRPGIYTFKEGERLDSLLTRCGGFLPDAFVRGTIFRRNSVRIVEQERLEEARQRLQQEAAQVSLTQAQIASASSSGSSGSGSSAATMMMLQNVLISSQNQQAEGRIVIHLDSELDGKKGPDNLTLEDGDEIDVPVLPSSINVLGEVNHPSSFLRVKSITVRDYIDQAGGFTPYADKKAVMVIKADGSVLTEDGFDNARRSRVFPALPLISGGLMSDKLDVGDTIFVPEDLTGFQNVQMAKDITTIIANSATGLAVLGLLATKL